MDDDNGSVIGGDPLRDGMHLSLRYRRDFVVTDAARLLAAARRVFLELNPDAAPQDADVAVTCAADAIFTILEGAGLFGDALESRLAAHEADGLRAGGSRAQVVIDEPDPLRAGWDCFRTGDVYALPPSAVDP
ncbi:hypothetical protein OHA72_34340 [Dactylosporangium sp. NBC_01737]|uniref:hypothetical protein n=1 Tax=Dactylosporangium sp. NBC_01737 TaxID=2975959 RepID=UPI002E14246A|nr:hypothetical protein OHA72_34340 [Dactylosporangium sp. NBC_01737]